MGKMNEIQITLIEIAESKGYDHNSRHDVGVKTEGELVLVYCKDCEGDVSAYFRRVEVDYGMV